MCSFERIRAFARQVHMSTRLLLKLVVAFALVVAAGFGLGRLDGSGSAVAQEPSETWNSTMVWRPMLDEAVRGLAEIVNQIDASCDVVDPVQSTNGEAPDGPVYAFTVTWSC
jgi:hypothetical protein